MIELSKCPNCASEDRVTIAGKDFCMRCGTPSEDNAMISASQSTGVQAAGQSTVTKFSQPQQSASPFVVDAQHDVTSSQTQSNYDQQASVNDEHISLPQQASVSGDGLTGKVEAVGNKPSTSLDNNTITDPPVIPATEVHSTLTDLAPSATAINSSPATINQDSINNPELVAPIAPTAITGNTMPSTNAAFSLDKSEPGVLSNEQLHALSTVDDKPAAPTGPTALEPNMPSSNVMPSLTTTAASTNQAAQAPASQLATPDKHAQATAGLPEDLKLQPIKQAGSAKAAIKPVAAIASVILVFVAGFYLWKVNYPGLAFKIASSKAGISATMPGYVPDGYSLNGNIQASPGSVSYNLSSQGNNKIQISQTKTDWDSQALAENYVSPKADNYLALQAQGLTIYMMGNNQASWVNKGTWYRIESPGQSLTKDQVIKIATSL